MKIFKISISLMLFSIFLIIFTSCNNDTFTLDTESNMTNNVSSNMTARNGEYSELMTELEERLVTDESFINFTKSYFKSKILISEIEIRKKLDPNYEVAMFNDSINVETAAVQSSLAYLTLFYDNNQDFDLLSDEEKEIVTNNVVMRAFDNYNETIAVNPNATFQSSSLESAVGDFHNDFNELVGTLPPIAYDPISNQPIASVNGLTWGEVGGCAVNALGTFIGDNFKVIKGIYSLLSGGAVTYTLALAAVGVICPQVKVGIAIITFAACLVGAYFF